MHTIDDELGENLLKTYRIAYIFFYQKKLNS